ECDRLVRAQSPRPELVGVLGVGQPPALAGQCPGGQGQGCIGKECAQRQQQQRCLQPVVPCDPGGGCRERVPQCTAADLAEEHPRPGEIERQEAQTPGDEPEGQPGG